MPEPQTQRLVGVGIGQGVAQGPVIRMADPLPVPSSAPSTQTPEAELARATAAMDLIQRDLAKRAATATGTLQPVLEAQALMAEDPDLADSVAEQIAAGNTAERAVHLAFGEFKDGLKELGGYLAERAPDLDYVASCVIAELSGVPMPGVPQSPQPFVLVAHDLAPADTALLDLTKVLALVTSEGGPTSHTAILAREQGIVAVVGTAGALEIRDRDVVIVDAAAGEVLVHPSAEELSQATERAAARANAATAPITPGALADGTPVPLLANLGSPDGATKAVALGAEGVGLFRTEFLFLSSEEAPTVADQEAAYRKLLAAFPGKKVVVRVLDAGADKPLKFLTDATEENPALGLRGVRVLRVKEQILRDQLAALAAADAATEADLWVMAPMVATVEEAEYFTALGQELGLRTVGVMVEVPSAALIAHHILAVTDFASIGTNDLTQYTMAADRLLGSVANLQDPWHPAVLQLIRSVGAAGAAQGRPVGVCGEAASDPLLAVVLVGLGATSLSMSPSALADVRASLRAHSLAQAQAAAAAACAAVDAETARAAARAALRG